MQADDHKLNTDMGNIYTPSELNHEARLHLEAGFGRVWVEGEISNLSRPASGHMYFSLKDEKAQISCALFRSNAYGMSFKTRKWHAGAGTWTCQPVRGTW